MSDNKPVSFGDIADPSAPPKTASDAAERLHASLEKVKGSMFDDETFVENILRKCVDSPGSFVRRDLEKSQELRRKLKDIRYKDELTRPNSLCTFRTLSWPS